MTATPARASAETAPTDGAQAPTQASVQGTASARTAARLAAVQALYQIEATDAAPTEVIKDFLTGRTGGILMTEDPDTAQESVVRTTELDTETFIGLVRTVEDRGSDIDGMIRGALSPEWPWDRLEMTLKALLRAAVAEILTRTDIPTKATVSEFIDIAHAFYDGSEPRMLNAVLDKIARALGRLDQRTPG
jgi:N utilization substance protein B